MIWHLWKLIWHRKKNSLLIVLEIFVSFLVVFVVTAMGIFYLDNYRRPLGFSYQGVWDILVVTGEEERTDELKFKTEEIRGRLHRLVQEIQDFPEISGAAVANMAPYDGTEWQNGYSGQDFFLSFGYDQVSDAFPEVMGLQLIRGRWFDKRDDGINFDPVLVNQQFAEMAFRDADPIGRNLKEYTGPKERASRIVGIFTDYRKHGEFSEAEPFVLFRNDLSDSQQPTIPRHILIRLRPDTPLSFEEPLVSRMHSIEQEWSFEVQPIGSKREDFLRRKILPWILLGIVAVFMMLMVGSGLLGVLWLSITRRTQEIGLRRAQGASAGDIFCQILLEGFLIASLGVGLGWFVTLQLPLIEQTSFLQTGVLLYGIALSTLLIYALVLLCALYPAFLAARHQPAEALHHE